MAYVEKKPINRSKARILCGHIFFTIKKYIKWYFSFKRYTNVRSKDYYEKVIFSHNTPLYRKLKDVEMYLQENKVENLKIAISKLDGIVIMPGQYFSYWKLIGRPTYRKGYKDGMILTAKGGFEEGVGGGLCQLSNLIYWMTLHTPLKVTERYRHSHDVFPDAKRTQPFGTGATCYYNFLDLEIKNESNIYENVWVFYTKNILVTILFIILPGFIGWVQGWINEKKSSGSIIPSWIAHSIMNILSGVMTAF